MVSENVVNSIANFLKKSEMLGMDNFTIYNRWVQHSGIIIHDSNQVDWLITFIADMKKVFNTALRNL